MVPKLERRAKTLQNPDFHTQKGYEVSEKALVTPAMEDYLEMIYRLSQREGYTRVYLLSRNLHVKPSSASKMADQLKRLGLVESQRYGYLSLTPQGVRLGEYLLYRHRVLHEFLCRINQSDNELEQTERIEHFIDRRTVENIARLLKSPENPDIL